MSAPEETHQSWLGWVFIREHVRRRITTDPIAPFLEPSCEQWTEGHWLPVAPSNREPLHCLSVLRVCLIFKRWNSVTILNQGCLSCLMNWRELSRHRSRPQVRLEKVTLSGKPLDPPFIHAVREETRCFIDAPLRYIVSSGPECLLMGWVGVGAGGTEQ